MRVIYTLFSEHSIMTCFSTFDKKTVKIQHNSTDLSLKLGHERWGWTEFLPRMLDVQFWSVYFFLSGSVWLCLTLPVSFHLLRHCTNVSLFLLNLSLLPSPLTPISMDITSCINPITPRGLTQKKALIVQHSPLREAPQSHKTAPRSSWQPDGCSRAFILLMGVWGVRGQSS